MRSIGSSSSSSRSFREDGVRVCAVGQEDAVGQNALQHRLFAVRLRPEPLPWIGVCKARDRHDLARARLVERAELAPE
ncbi:MAG: hypothetical protein ACLUEU_10885 [Oscillospiraceae bacterium]